MAVKKIYVVQRYASDADGLPNVELFQSKAAAQSYLAAACNNDLADMDDDEYPTIVGTDLEVIEGFYSMFPDDDYQIIEKELFVKEQPIATTQLGPQEEVYLDEFELMAVRVAVSHVPAKYVRDFIKVTEATAGKACHRSASTLLTDIRKKMAE